jgi:SAM-dependent methyltransferase
MTHSLVDSWETNIYAQRKQINRYPFTDLVSDVMSLYGARLRAGEKLRVLELGSGTGNNLVFLAEQGFQAYGVDGSKTACRLAKEFLNERGVCAEIVQANFVNLPYPNNYFDLIVDRAAVYCNKKDDIQKVVLEVKRCLTRGGRYLSFVFANDHFEAKNNHPSCIEKGTYSDFEGGPFGGTGIVHFFSENEIVSEYMAEFEIEFLYHVRNDALLPIKGNKCAEFHVCGRKL